MVKHMKYVAILIAIVLILPIGNSFAQTEISDYTKHLKNENQKLEKKVRQLENEVEQINEEKRDLLTQNIQLKMQVENLNDLIDHLNLVVGNLKTIVHAQVQIIVNTLASFTQNRL